MLALGEQLEAAMPTTGSSSAGPMSHPFEEFSLASDGTEAAHDPEEGRHFTSDPVQGSHFSFPVVEEEQDVEIGDPPVPDEDPLLGTDATGPLGKH